jgi:hypothetical protein
MAKHNADDAADPYNSARYHTGKLCIEGCGRPAGTRWSPYWCWQCNVARMARITEQLNAIFGRRADG